MRGVAEFAELWERRTTLQGGDGTIYELLSLPDPVQAQKTQRDKDWPMIRRLIEADRIACPGTPSPAQVRFKTCSVNALSSQPGGGSLV